MGADMGTPPVLDDLRTLTVEDVASLLGTSQETVRRYVRDGHLIAMRWGRRLRFYVKDVRAFQQGRRVRPTEAVAILNEQLRRKALRSGRDDQ